MLSTNHYVYHGYNYTVICPDVFFVTVYVWEKPGKDRVAYASTSMGNNQLGINKAEDFIKHREGIPSNV